MIKYRLLIAFMMIFINFHVKAQHFFEKSFSLRFAGEISNQVAYIQIPLNSKMWGNIEIQLTGGYNGQLNRGVLTKRIDIVYNGTAEGYLSQQSEITQTSEPFSSYWAIGEFDGVNSRIPIYHLNSKVNEINIKVKMQIVDAQAAAAIASGLSVSEPVEVANTVRRGYRHFSDSRIGIGTQSPEHRLDVVGTVRAHEVRVNTLKTADFVFDKNYELPNLDSVKVFIDKNKHLPGIQSAKEMEKSGINVGAFQIDLLQKIEELTLHLIQATDRINTQEQRIKELEAKR